MSEREESHDSQLDREGQSDGEEVVFREGGKLWKAECGKFHLFHTQRVTTDGDHRRPTGSHRGLKNEVPTPLRGHTRHPVGLG